MSCDEPEPVPGETEAPGPALFLSREDGGVLFFPGSFLEE
jgi:hypothetical protein